MAYLMAAHCGASGAEAVTAFVTPITLDGYGCCCQIVFLKVRQMFGNLSLLFDFKEQSGHAGS